MPTYAGVRVVGVPAPAPVSAALYCATKNHLWAKGGCAKSVLPSPALSGTGLAGRGLHARLSAWITKLPVNIDMSVSAAQGRVNGAG